MSRRCSVFVALLALALTAGNGGPIRQLSYDPDAPVVELFDGEAAGQLSLRMVAQNPKSGLVFVTNRTTEMLSVSVPQAVAGIHILPQFGAGLGNQNGFGQQSGFGQQNGFGNNQAGGNGMGQNVGGTLGAMGNNQGFPGGPGGINGLNQNGGNPNGNGFFSIPPGKTVQLQLRSVCLSYGRPDPSTAMKYKLIRVEDQTSDPVLQELLAGINERTDRDAVQAAAWHLANDLTWEQLARLSNQRLPGVVTPMFSTTTVRNAQSLVETAEKLASARPAASTQPVAVTAPRTR